MSNIKKIQDMLLGKHKQKVQVGYESATLHQREEGEEWIDARGRRWIKENGKRKQITKTDGIGFKHCNDCKKMILKKIDEDTYNRMQRCYYCQIDFEAKLKDSGKWKDWVVEQERMRFESVKDEIMDALKEAGESKTLKMDKSVAYAIANENRKGTL
jgi:hypothetical protein